MDGFAVHLTACSCGIHTEPMRIDQTCRITLIRFAVPLAIVIASPLLPVAGAPIRRRRLRHVCREEAPALLRRFQGGRRQSRSMSRVLTRPVRSVCGVGVGAE